MSVQTDTLRENSLYKTKQEAYDDILRVISELQCDTLSNLLDNKKQLELQDYLVNGLKPPSKLLEYPKEFFTNLQPIISQTTNRYAPPKRLQQLFSSIRRNTLSLDEKQIRRYNVLMAEQLSTKLAHILNGTEDKDTQPASTLIEYCRTQAKDQQEQPQDVYATCDLIKPVFIQIKNILTAPQGTDVIGLLYKSIQNLRKVAPSLELRDSDLARLVVAVVTFMLDPKSKQDNKLQSALLIQPLSKAMNQATHPYLAVAFSSLRYDVQSHRLKYDLLVPLAKAARSEIFGFNRDNIFAERSKILSEHFLKQPDVVVIDDDEPLQDEEKQQPMQDQEEPQIVQEEEEPQIVQDQEESQPMQEEPSAAAVSEQDKQAKQQAIDFLRQNGIELQEASWINLIQSLVSTCIEQDKNSRQKFKATVQQLDNNLDDMRKNLSQVTAQRQQLENNLDEMRKELAQDAAKRQELENNLDEMRKELAQVSAQRQQAIDEKEVLQKQVQSNEAKLIAAKYSSRKIAALESDIAELNTKLEQCNQQRDDCLSKLRDQSLTRDEALRKGKSPQVEQEIVAELEEEEEITQEPMEQGEEGAMCYQRKEYTSPAQMYEDLACQDNLTCNISDLSLTGRCKPASSSDTFIPFGEARVPINSSAANNQRLLQRASELAAAALKKVSTFNKPLPSTVSDRLKDFCKSTPLPNIAPMSVVDAMKIQANANTCGTRFQTKFTPTQQAQIRAAFKRKPQDIAGEPSSKRS